MTLLLI